MAPADFADLRRQQTVFAGLAAFRMSNSNLTGGGEPERLWNFEVTAGFFRLLGFEAALGRAFIPEEEQAGRGQVRCWGTVDGSGASALIPRSSARQSRSMKKPTR